MTETIRRLWGGEIAPYRLAGINNREIRKAERIIQENRKHVEKNLTDEVKKMFDNYNLGIEEYISLIFEQGFCDGFCLGTKLFAEAMTGGE